MAFKKSVHITLYSYDKLATLPSNCSSKGRDNITNNFTDLSYNAVLCDIMKVMSNSSEPHLVQTVRLLYQDNYITNMAYTYQKGLLFEKR